MFRTVPLSIVVLAALGVTFGCSQSDGNDRHDESKPESREHRDHNSKPAVALLEQGRGLYKGNCAACHGETGRGDGPAAGVLKPPPRDHTDRAYMSTLTDDQIKQIIKMGGAIKGKPLMPSHPQFKDPQLDALVAYVRSLSNPPR